MHGFHRMYFSLSLSVSLPSALSRSLDKQTCLGYDSDGTVLICEANWSMTKLKPSRVYDLDIQSSDLTPKLCASVNSPRDDVLSQMHAKGRWDKGSYFGERDNLTSELASEVGGRECHMLSPKLKKCIPFSILSLFC